MLLSRAVSYPAAPTVAVTLSEWRVEAPAHAEPGPITFVVTNRGTIPHAFEVEGSGLEKETASIPAGGTARLTVTLRAGTYELYCPIGEDSHKKLGMMATLVVGRPKTDGASGMASGAMAHMDAPPASTHALHVVGGGPVIQILPGPFPFADSAAAVIRERPDDQKDDLTHKAQLGPYSNTVARVSGTFSIDAWDRGAAGDSVNGVAEFVTQDGAHWRLVMDRVQTKDIPFNPRFGGVIMGLYYHGASHVHTPLVPTIRSSVALWAFGRLSRDGTPVADGAMVHVMLLSRTRRPSDFALDCWDCSKNPIEELQLQITPAPGQPKFDAPGGFLFLNWQQSSGTALANAAPH